MTFRRNLMTKYLIQTKSETLIMITILNQNYNRNDRLRVIWNFLKKFA